MGGIGSGGYERQNVKHTVEEGRFLDIRHWQREGLLKPGLRFNLVWGPSGQLTLGVAVRVEEHQVVMAYRYPQSDGSLTLVEYPVALDRTPGPFGGQRTWFRCPNEGCGRRVALLHLGDFRFACRHCQQLAYSSQREDPIDRNLRRVRKINRKLGGCADSIYSSPDKPKGMRWRTYEGLINEAEMAQFRAMRAVLDSVGGDR